MEAEACPGPHREELGEAGLCTRCFCVTCLALSHTDAACKCGYRCLETSAFLRTWKAIGGFHPSCQRVSVAHCPGREACVLGSADPSITLAGTRCPSGVLGSFSQAGLCPLPPTGSWLFSSFATVDWGTRCFVSKHPV